MSFLFQAEDGIRDLVRSRGLGDVYKRQAVLELAADEFGEIELLAQVVRPRVGLITAIHESHLDVFGSLEAIAQEKGALLSALPANGLALLNADDPRVLALAARSVAPVLTVGTSVTADVRVTVRIATPIVAATLAGVYSANRPPAGQVNVTFGPAAHARLPIGLMFAARILLPPHAPPPAGPLVPPRESISGPPLGLDGAGPRRAGQVHPRPGARRGRQRA